MFWLFKRKPKGDHQPNNDYLTRLNSKELNHLHHEVGNAVIGLEMELNAAWVEVIKAARHVRRALHQMERIKKAVREKPDD